MPEPIALNNVPKSLIELALNELLDVSVAVELVGGASLGAGVLCSVVRAV